MKPAFWRVILLTLCGAGILFVLSAFVDQSGAGGAAPWYGVWGGYFDGSTQPYHLTFRGVDPGGPADRGGLRERDSIDVRRHALLERLSLMGQPLGGHPISFSVERGSQRSTAVVVPGPLYFSRFWNYVLWEFGSLWLLLFAGLIAWRRPYADNNLLLATVLASAAIGFNAESLFFAVPWAWGYIALAIVNQAFPLSVALWAVLASGFARPPSMMRRCALAVCLALVGVAIAVGDGTPDRSMGLAPLIATITLWFDPTRFVGPLWTLPIDLAIVAAWVCGGLAISAARGVERQRAMWLLIPLAVFYGIVGMTTLAFHFFSYAALLAMGQAYSIVAVITPLLLTYVALNRRLIDVGFVLNRTVVFAIVSTIVIGAFVLVEWAAGAWLVNASHTTSALVGMAVALVLGLSLRYIHRYVDRVVDYALFRKRHEDESALRRFAHESSYVTDRDVLVERAIRTVVTHTNAVYADIFVRNGTAAYVSTSDHDAAVDENDPAFVSLSAWNKPLDLHGVQTALRGELAFPLISRGRLLGALVCGPKRDGETYAPDETDALLALGRGVGGALDVLEAKSSAGGDPRLSEICESIRMLSEVTRAMPDTIAERLRGSMP